jgi:uncharacterized protein (DUF1697 family)
LKTYLALLRGINVSGKNPIKMNELVVHFESLGYQKVRTYIQSGNILFEAEVKDNMLVEIAIHNKITREYGFNVPVFVKSANELKEIYNNNLFVKERNLDIEKLHVTILSGIPRRDNVEKLKAFQSNKDEYIIYKNNIFLYCPDGYGKTKFSNTFFENKLKLIATTRNWKTVGKLVEVASKL